MHQKREWVNSSCKCIMNSVANDFMGRLIMEEFSGSIIKSFYQRGRTDRGPVLCSLLTLVLRKECDQ